MSLVIIVVAIRMYINLKKIPERSYWVQNLSTESDTISSHSISDRVYLEDGNESGYVSSHDLSHDYGSSVLRTPDSGLIYVKVTFAFN